MINYKIVNEYNLIDVDEKYAIDILLKDDDLLDSVYLNKDLIEQYNNSCDTTYQDKTHFMSPSTIMNMYTKEEYFDKCINNWFIPTKYKNINLKSYFYSKIETIIEKNRVDLELSLIKKHKLEDMIRSLIYLVDILAINNILWGVGRGSSVSLYILYLIDLHAIDSIKYEIDPYEFFKQEKEIN